MPPQPHGTERHWRASSHSSGGDRVEWAPGGGSVPVRDSKDPDGPILTFTPEGWTAFVTAVRSGEFGEFRTA